MSSQRLFELDALRGIAAFSVVLFHYLFRYDGIYGHDTLNVTWFEFGKYGVQLFFMVSGFVIFWTLSRTKRPLDFLVSRFSRLYPVYWVALAITFVSVTVLGLEGRESSLFDAFSNMLMFHEYFLIPHVDGVYWTLTVELTFYLWMFILYCSSNLERVEGFSIVILVFSMLYCVDLIHIPYVIRKILLMNYLPFFLAGICFYKIINTCENKLTRVALFISLFSVIFIYSVNEFFIFLSFYIIFFLALNGSLSILACKPLIFLGSISYSLYLLHQNIGYIVINLFYDIDLSPILGVVTAIIVSVFLASLITRYVEKPSLDFIRNKYKEIIKN
ncbi:MAG: acyltransferase [Oleispira sp.]|nr:acyltransferase [Oleispira sp.]MBL4880068.1 acyltransferase [Oleispira sp.]